MNAPAIAMLCALLGFVWVSTHGTPGQPMSRMNIARPSATAAPVIASAQVPMTATSAALLSPSAQ